MRKEHKGKSRGFTLIELLIGSTIMLVTILAALYIYGRSNKVSVDQQQYAQVQHDVRSGMYFITRDVRMAGCNLPGEFMGYFLDGVDNDTTDTQAAVRTDRLKMIGNDEDPLLLKIHGYQGSSVTVDLNDFSFEEYPYPDGFYDNKLALVLPNPSSGCRAGELRWITHVTHSQPDTNEKLNFSPGLAPGINPPGGLSGTCSQSSDYDGGAVVFANLIEYWLDVTGHYPGLTAGSDGYIGNGHGGILYKTENGVHMPLALNVENLQFEYNGDFNYATDPQHSLDGFQAWNSTWTLEQVAQVREIRVLVLGYTPNRMVSVSGTPPNNIFLYRRPAVANSPGASQDDMRRRFLLESTANIRNMSANIYNTGER